MMVEDHVQDMVIIGYHGGPKMVPKGVIIRVLFGPSEGPKWGVLRP